MNPLLLQIAALVLGLAALVWSADRFVAGAAATARLSGMPAFLVGMLVVGFGTSAPEMTVSAFAAAGGNPGIALGNAYGSNVANIALILGVCAAIRTMRVERASIARDMLPLLAVTAGSWLLFRDDALSRREAWLLLGVFAVWMAASAWLGARRGAGAEDAAPEEPLPSGRRAAFDLVVGLVVLVASSRGLVWGAVGIARALGVSDLLIGLTVVAHGTSLPELASSVAATLRGEDDLAVGNVVGSNMFNTLAVVGIAGAIRPMPDLPDAVFRRDLPATLAFTAALILFSLPAGRRRECAVRRSEGILLFLLYVGYIVLLVRSRA